jgi:nucleoside 2-deoxyribosyltransferase
MAELKLKLFDGGVLADRNCPLCFSNKCSVRQEEDGAVSIQCRTYGTDVRFDSSVFSEGAEVQRKLMELAVEKLVRDGGKEPLTFGLGPGTAQGRYCDLEAELKNYPATFMDKARRALMNLSARYPQYGVPFTADENDCALLFCAAPQESDGLCRIMCDLHWLKAMNGRGTFMITAEGWKEAESGLRDSRQVRQAFIAMSYCEGSQPIREGFRTAIETCGYFPCIIDEVEHNGQIVPEIFYEIGRSRFLVADVTYPNYGAYYEAGYAQGMGKEVIVCCREDVVSGADRPHFDIAQKFLVIWRTEDELIERLCRRIEATIT